MRKLKNEKTKGKKIVSVLMLSAMLGSLGMTYVEANNHGDTEFNFLFDYSTGDPYDYSEIRAKEDNTSSYMNYTTGSYSFTASVVAAYNYGNRADDDAVRRVNKNIIPGNWYYLTNYIMEDGFDYASIRGECNYDNWYNARGVWSPDSI